jgi:nucleotide-binding universal stress UspA family protein
MFERILLPLDGSPVAEALLDRLGPILTRNDSELLLLRVAPTSVYPYAELPIVVPDIRIESRAYVQRIAQGLIERGARARPLVEEGPPAGTILDVAEREKATLIAMPTHGRTGIARWVFGSVTEKVVRASPVPLLVVRSFPAVPSPLSFERILVPIVHFHFKIMPHVREVARLFGSRVAIVHVVEPGEDASTRDQAQAEIRTLVNELKENGIPTEVLERKGDPAHEILEACRQEQAGLIAITTHGRHGPTRWALGSVTEKVLRSSPVPLLVVRNV